MTKTNLEIWKEQEERYAFYQESLDAGHKHREEHPLDERTKQLILERYKAGDSFCCEKGLHLLRRLDLDECWADYINVWAYENLGCNDSYKPGGSLYAHGLGKLVKFIDEDC